MTKNEIRIGKPQEASMFYETMKVLRPHLDLRKFEEQLVTQMKEGYQLIYVIDDDEVVALAGFRTLNTLFSGKTLYIDDLVVKECCQQHGYGKQLMKWIIAHAKQHEYSHLSLDSGFTRKKAHRFYLSLGMQIESLHFGRKTAEL